MPQAVKGNEGRYSGLLLHDHPKTHPRINEGAGGWLISLYCGAAGTGGAGQSGLKRNPLEKHSGLRCAAWAAPSICPPFKTFHRFWTCPGHSDITSLTAVRQKERRLQPFKRQNNKTPVTNASIADAFASSRALLAQFC